MIKVHTYTHTYTHTDTWVFINTHTNTKNDGELLERNDITPDASHQFNGKMNTLKVVLIGTLTQNFCSDLYKKILRTSIQFQFNHV